MIYADLANMSAPYISRNWNSKRYVSMVATLLDHNLSHCTIPHEHELTRTRLASTATPPRMPPSPPLWPCTAVADLPRSGLRFRRGRRERRLSPGTTRRSARTPTPRPSHLFAKRRNAHVRARATLGRKRPPGGKQNTSTTPPTSTSLDKIASEPSSSA